MKAQIETQIIIKSSPEKVWKNLIDFNSYSNWNSFITSIQGTAAVGEQLVANINKSQFKPTVLIATPNKELRWLGKLLFSGIFNGEHYFQITETSDGNTLLTHGENFKGILVPMFKNKLHTDIKNGFESMNEALKRLCEQ